jgi:glutathione peroxidase
MLNIFYLVTTLLTSFFSNSFTDTNGNITSFSSFQGKKILIVNIATNSSKINQLASLEQLQERFGDSLVIVAFPSNSFGNEPRTDAEIRSFCQSNYSSTFRIAQKASVVGNGIHQVYSWLAQSSENGSMNGIITSDFQKFLIDGEGNLAGYFSPKVDPMDPKVITAISSN